MIQMQTRITIADNSGAKVAECIKVLKGSTARGQFTRRTAGLGDVIIGAVKKDIAGGDRFSLDNVWVKRPGTGEIKAKDFESLLGKRAKTNISRNTQISWMQIDD